MRTIGIMTGGALLALAAGAQAQAQAPQLQPVPAAGAYYGAAPTLAAPGYSAWQSAPVDGPEPMARGSHHGDRKGYHAYRRGARMGDIWRDPTYAVNDWSAWGLGQPGPGMHWLRYYDDAVLVDGYGSVVDVHHGVDWDGPRRGPMPGYAGGPGFPGPGFPGPGYGAPGASVYRAGPNTTVTTQVIGGAPYGYGGAYPVGPGTLIITPGSVITTTTTTSEETVYRNVYRKRVYRRPVRHYRPRCVQAPTCPVQGS
ncbi:MAG TPA: RcnB family protein [Sphingomonas sp.]